MSLFTQNPAAEHAAITTAVQRYIDGYLGQDAALLRRAFHTDAKLITIDNGAVAGSPTAEWFDRTERKRQSGGGPLTARSQILGIDASQVAAVAKVKLEFATHEFIDYLSLLKAGTEWVIVNKIYAAKDK